MTRRSRLPRTLSAEALERIAARFKALSEPNRLKLILALEAGEKNVSQLVEVTGLAQANVSRHLHTLTEEGILTRRKEGLNAIFSIGDPSIFALCEHVCGAIEKQVQRRMQAFDRREERGAA